LWKGQNDEPKGLSTGAKVGIGTGVSIAGILLVLGVCFIGMSIRRKAKKRIDTETASYGWKPELDGTTKFFSKTDLDGDSSMIKEADATSTIAKTPELSTQPASIANTGRVEMGADLGGVEIDSTAIEPQYHELHGEHKLDGTPVSPTSSDAHHTSISRRDTYDDPTLVLNPSAEDDEQPRP